MNFSHFFIRRPIFAAVLSIVIVLVGGIAVFQLPIAQYPEIAPPTVVVRAVYPGANPKVLAESQHCPSTRAESCRHRAAEITGRSPPPRRDHDEKIH
jgi:multidrug efflux pump